MQSCCFITMLEGHPQPEIKSHLLQFVTSNTKATVAEEVPTAAAVWGAVLFKSTEIVKSDTILKFPRASRTLGGSSQNSLSPKKTDQSADPPSSQHCFHLTSPFCRHKQQPGFGAFFSHHLGI